MAAQTICAGRCGDQHPQRGQLWQMALRKRRVSFRPRSAWAEGRHPLGWPAWRTGHVCQGPWRQRLPPGLQQKWPKQEEQERWLPATRRPFGSLCHPVEWKKIAGGGPVLAAGTSLVCKANGFPSVAHMSRREKRDQGCLMNQLRSFQLEVSILENVGQLQSSTQSWGPRPTSGHWRGEEWATVRTDCLTRWVRGPIQQGTSPGESWCLGSSLSGYIKTFSSSHSLQTFKKIISSFQQV